ncbi:hypothetical protein JTE90_022920 [Oedothorax gibbosus]|uniref:Uncharacterized protein n=1 Tax=Oedothorax gibbosus TaxID=931172 RepID=A0AAV6TGG8_9ARAC|nr:hypothetical protein JTE90_022920 [Oedothorax gibbosus]
MVLNSPAANESTGRGGRPHSGSPFPRGRGAPETRRVPIVEVAEFERTRWDPKDGELCPDRTRPEETLVEVRSGSDVQIDRQIWV